MLECIDRMDVMEVEILIYSWKDFIFGGMMWLKLIMSGMREVPAPCVQMDIPKLKCLGYGSRISVLDGQGMMPWAKGIRIL